MFLLCVLCAHSMYLDKKMDLSDQWMVTKMMYGAQSDEFDYHMVRIIFRI